MRSTIRELFTIEFWTAALDYFRDFGPVMPIALTFLESFLPMLPLVGIVALNIAAYGTLLGFIYTWIGASLGGIASFLLFRKVLKGWFLRIAERRPNIARARKWVEGISTPALFLMIIMPFTPISLVNFAFGVSDYPTKKYLVTLCTAKVFMLMMLVMISRSVIRAFTEPLFIFVSLVLIAVGIYLSKSVMKRNNWVKE